MRHLISLAFLFAITFNVYGQVPDYVPSDGLVAWYPFNGNANDESGNGNDGVVNGALLVPDRNGNQSSAYGFDGLNAQISLPDLPSPTTYTLSAWATKLAGDYDTRYILSDFGTGESGGPEGIALLKNNTGIYSHTAGLGGDGACFSGENIVDDQWNHIVVIRNSANVSFWINGELISTDACITPDPIDRLGLAFIGSGVTSQQHWKGNIDDVGFWNRALSASEITSLFNAPSPIQGCTDETACNYDDEATNDDSSCEYNITPVDLGEDITTCDASVTLDAGEGYVSYLWSNGETTQSIEVSESGDYSIEVGNGDVSSSSLSFDGENDYVRINEGSDFFGSTGDFTAACWLKLDDNVQGVAEPIFESNIQNELQLMIVNNDGRLTCNAGGGLIAESIALVWDTNTWYHVAISNLSGHLKFYRNGIELGYSQEPYSGNINTRSFSSLNIGKDDDEDDPYSVWLDGSISDFVYWDIALSAFEVNNYIT
ncbi:MAG: LamG domain-containing protein, partial [Flavobacteriales bacterium]|nr:LamG domain-containing protein [Flavobacteriales bacterium]